LSQHKLQVFKILDQQAYCTRKY